MRRLIAGVGALLLLVAAWPPAGALGQRAGTATFRVPGGCVRAATFRAVLTGTRIERATFLVDGRRHGSLTRPNAGRAWVATIRTRSLKVGTHPVAVRVVFTAASGSRPRVLTVGVRRCAPQRPRFTG